MHEELFTIAFDLLSSYVLPGKVFDVLVGVVYDVSLIGHEDITSVDYQRLRIDATKSAASALHAAQKKIDEKYSKEQTAWKISNGFLPVDWDKDELELQA